MKKLLLAYILTSPLFFVSQTWTKISTNFDSLWTSSVKYYNKGDTLVYFGSTEGTGAFATKRFYVSTDGGYNFTRDFTALDNIGFEAFYSLPLNNLLFGFKNTPNNGTYKFGGLNNWQNVFVGGGAYGVWGDLGVGTAIFQPYGSPNIFSFDLATNSAISTILSGTNSITLRTVYHSGNRILLAGNGVKYFDNGNVNLISNATGIAGTVLRFFNSNNILYAVSSLGGNDNLYKSTDNGATWNLQTTTFLNGANTNTLVSAYTIGTPNGNIFYLETSSGTSNNVFLSTNGGQTASKISNGLPSNGSLISPTIGKLLTNGNKVWYQVCKANNVDFVRTDTSVAGLYIFNNVVSVNEIPHQTINFCIYPNPAKEIINIKLNNVNSELTIISVSNVLGETVLTENTILNNLTLKTTQLTNGIYFVTVTNQGKSNTQKIIIE